VSTKKREVRIFLEFSHNSRIFRFFEVKSWQREKIRNERSIQINEKYRFGIFATFATYSDTGELLKQRAVETKNKVQESKFMEQAKEKVKRIFFEFSNEIGGNCDGKNQRSCSQGKKIPRKFSKFVGF
jgi:hypothetical protein